MYFMDAVIFKRYMPVHLFVHHTFIGGQAHLQCVPRWSNAGQVGSLYQSCVRLFVWAIEVIMMEMDVLSHIKIA